MVTAETVRQWFKTANLEVAQMVHGLAAEAIAARQKLSADARARASKSKGAAAAPAKKRVRRTAAQIAADQAAKAGGGTPANIAAISQAQDQAFAHNG